MLKSNYFKFTGLPYEPISGFTDEVVPGSKGNIHSDHNRQKRYALTGHMLPLNHNREISWSVCRYSSQLSEEWVNSVLTHAWQVNGCCNPLPTSAFPVFPGQILLDYDEFPPSFLINMQRT